ncbi:MAG: sulfite oxidase-like oxidoreductase [Armatimonadota bacterium]
MTDPNRLPPGQHETKDFPVLHVGNIPRVSLADWDLRIEGEVRHLKRLTYDELRALPSVIDVSDFHCVTTFSIFDLAWQGVRFSDLADLVSPTERARFVTVGCDGGYTTSLPIEDMMRPDVLLAWGLNGEDLSPEHGYPLRLVVPHKYAYKAAKWVRWIRFTYDQETGYWEQRGYSNSADPWKEERLA